MNQQNNNEHSNSEDNKEIPKPQINTILIKYNELALKGKNRDKFAGKLISNIHFAIKKHFPESQHKLVDGEGRIYLYDIEWSEELKLILSNIFGIFAFSPSVRFHGDIEKIKSYVYEFIKEDLKNVKTFAIKTKRANKKFPMRCLDVDREVGGFVKSHFENLTVSIMKPEFKAKVEIRVEGVYMYKDSFPGLRGLPYGTNDKALLLLSGGIDSPVAAHLMHKRGVVCSYCYFHSYPYTSNEALEKVKTLAKTLQYNLQPTKLFMVNFAYAQEQIRDKCYPNHRIILYRRLMMKIASRLADSIGAKVLATGENLGQVASQTIANMFVINNATDKLVLRPLVTFDKMDIMDMARKIGTYETSILPYPDSCTVFMPDNPIITANLDKVLKEESKLDIEEIIQATLNKTETIIIN